MSITGNVKDVKLCLVSTAGGHFFELYQLEGFWSKYNHFWVTLCRSDTEDSLKGEKVYWFEPVARKPFDYIKTLVKALKLLSKEKPNFVITTGANLGGVFVHASKLVGIKTIYIELTARMEDISLTGKIVYPFADHFLVQWEDLTKKFRRAKFVGRVF